MDILQLVSAWLYIQNNINTLPSDGLLSFEDSGVHGPSIINPYSYFLSLLLCPCCIVIGVLTHWVGSDIAVAYSMMW